MKQRELVVALSVGVLVLCGCPKAQPSTPLHTDATLSALAVAADGTAVALSPAFAADVHVYDVALPYPSQAATLTLAASDSAVKDITVTEIGTSTKVTSAVASGSSLSLVLPAAGASSTVRVVVTAEDGTTVLGYTLHLAHVAAGTTSQLSALVDSAGVLTFDPASASTSYTYDLPAALATGYTVTPTLKDPHATVRINGAAVASGAASAVIDLSSGSATVTIVVTAEDGTHATTYTLNVTVIATSVAVAAVSLSRPTLRLDPVDQPTGKLTAALLPANATDRALVWSSSNPTVATVDALGNVTAHAAGQAVIQAAAHANATLSASCTVFVFDTWFRDTFEDGTANAPAPRWTLLAASTNTTGPNGSFSSLSDGSLVLKYAANSTGGVLATVTDAAWTGVTTGNYYVEARIKPQTNSTTGNKQLYLIARYQDANNWYGAGLNVQNSTASTQVEIAKMLAGSLSRPGQVKRPIAMDTTWYTVRFELVGSTLTVFLDGELIKTLTDTSFTSGKIGLFTANKSFEIDDVKVGDPADRPVQLAISPNTAYAAEAGDPPRVITVSAQQPDYTDGGTYIPDTFTVASSDPSVVSADVDGGTVSLNALKAGTATVSFTSGSNTALTKSVTATVTPAFVQPTTTYTLTGTTVPAAGEPAAYADARLAITFDSAPTLGTTGSVRIFRTSDDAQIDVIKPSGETNALGYPGQDQARVVNASLLTVSGNTVFITPHNGKLLAGTGYYVAIANGVVNGVNLAGTPFTGIGKVGGWSFTTKADPDPAATSVAVDAAAPADFRTVQGALNFFMKNAAKDTAVTVNVKNGTYEELLFLRAKNNVSIVGETRDGVVLQYKNYEGLNTGSGASQVLGGGSPAGGRAVFLVETSDLLTLDTLTLKNTTTRSAAASAQAETIYFNNDAGRLIAKHAAFISEQDTLQLKGYAWFYQSLVAGNVDFIWGNNRVSLFEESEIRSLGDSTSATSGGFVVQARSVTAADKGFVFLNSSLTHGVGPGGNDVPTATAAATYLARSPGGTASWDNVAYVNCKMDTHIIPVGWAYNTAGQPIPNPATASAASGWREYGTMALDGTPASLASRVGGYTLTAGEVASGFSSRAQILAAFNAGAGWVPVP
jgi:pectate lyase